MKVFSTTVNGKELRAKDVRVIVPHLPPNFNDLEPGQSININIEVIEMDDEEYEALPVI